MKSTLEVADIFRAYGPAYRAQHAGTLSRQDYRAMSAIEACRTAVLGGHIDQCDQCEAVHIAYNSCRNRHCPKCQGLDKVRWLEARKQDLLPIGYFHVVFTLPEALRPLVLANQRLLYNLLFKAASQTLQQLARDPQHLGAEIGLTAVLHTWTQTLLYHPHLHCIVTGGGLSAEGMRWVGGRPDFFLPVKVVSRLFRGKFLAGVKQAYLTGDLVFSPTVAAWKDRRVFNQQLTGLYQTEWVVYVKPPFADAATTLAYLARYTHRVAIDNARLIRFEGEEVTFSYRDRSEAHQVKEATLTAFEFIRRFLLHILPHQFMKIRHYGLLSNRSRQTKWPQCLKLLGLCLQAQPPLKIPWHERVRQLTGRDPRQCPVCQKGRLRTRRLLLPTADRAPPRHRSSRLGAHAM